MKKPCMMIAALSLVVASSTAFASETAHAPVNTLDRAGRVTQSVGSHLSNAGVALHTETHELKLGLKRDFERPIARFDAAMARTGAGFRNAGQSLRTGMNKFGLNVRARWEAAKTATGAKMVQAGTKVSGGASLLATPAAKVYFGRTETIYRPNGARYYVTRAYQADSHGKLHEVASVATVKQAPAK